MFTEGLLRGRRVLITGGGTGLGKGMAEKFLSLGADPSFAGEGSRCARRLPPS
jgi:NAD(P)-dependent dehydrogenase (short-subunit alcohol dehydrogenase family)